MLLKPNNATAYKSFLPALACNGLSVSITAINNAPIAGAARNTPSPLGPTCKIWSANMGSKATAPPKNTANKSNESALNKSWLENTNRKSIDESSILRDNPDSYRLSCITYAYGNVTVETFPPI